MKRKLTFDLTGQRFWRLLVLGEAYRNRGVHWRCLCDCGKETALRTSVLRAGLTRSCGCWGKMIDRPAPSLLHGKAPFVLYRRWHFMRQRCSNPNHRSWKHYGGKGVTVCPEWQRYIAFRDWALANGWRDDLQIDRIDNDGNYEPDNCRIVAQIVNANNTSANHRIVWGGRDLTLAQWARELGIKYTALRNRIIKGWPLERALTEPPAPRKPRA